MDLGQTVYNAVLPNILPSTTSSVLLRPSSRRKKPDPGWGADLGQTVYNAVLPESSLCECIRNIDFPSFSWTALQTPSQYLQSKLLPSANHYMCIVKFLVHFREPMLSSMTNY